MEITLVVLSFSLLISSILSFCLYKYTLDLKKENNRLKKSNNKVVKYTDELLSMRIGDKAIIPDYPLIYKDENKDFKVNYEVEIIDISKDSVKVKALGFDPQDQIGRDPSNKSGIIKFMQNKWIKKSLLDLIVDDRMRRDRKLNDLGISD